MISAIELRIGNCISNGSSVIVDANTIYDIAFLKADFDPIPLTEEWLLKFGFEKNEIRSEYFIQCGEYRMKISVNVFSGTLEKDSSWFISILIGYGSHPFTLVKQYVHQLQNLYFALTGEELTLK